MQYLTTATIPPNNDGSEDESLREVGTTLKVARSSASWSSHPGVSPRNHRTDSIDYAVGMSGRSTCAGRLDRPPQGGRRAGPARHDPQRGSTMAPSRCVITFVLMMQAVGESAASRCLRSLGELAHDQSVRGCSAPRRALCCASSHFIATRPRQTASALGERTLPPAEPHAARARPRGLR